MSESDELHHVVIIGGGFGGLYAAKSLKNAPVRVTLIDRRNLHLFQPLLYQVATGGLSPGDIASPLRSVLRKNYNTRILMAEVTDIDKQSQKVFLDNLSIEYDSLIVATGSQNHYFGNSGWEKHAPGLKTVEDALYIRGKILSSFEKAEMSDDRKHRLELLTFVIVGAGPTGVELAGTAGELARYTLSRDYRTFDPKSARIFLVEGRERVLPSFPEKLSHDANRMLNDLGVEVILDTRVTDITENRVRLDGPGGESTIQTKTVLWAAGIQASPLGRIVAGDAEELLDESKRVMVEEDLSLPGYSNVFVIGDLANYIHQTGRPLPELAPVAIQQGRYVARLIEARLQDKSLKPFRYRDKGTLATIGRSRAVGEIWHIKFSGFTAWIVWLFVHLMYLVEFENRLLVFVQWAWNYFTWNRSARVITNVGAPTHPDREGNQEAAGSK